MGFFEDIINNVSRTPKDWYLATIAEKCEGRGFEVESPWYEEGVSTYIQNHGYVDKQGVFANKKSAVDKAREDIKDLCPEDGDDRSGKRRIVNSAKSVAGVIIRGRTGSHQIPGTGSFRAPQTGVVPAARAKPQSPPPAPDKKPSRPDDQPNKDILDAIFDGLENGGKSKPGPDEKKMSMHSPEELGFSSLNAWNLIAVGIEYFVENLLPAADDEAPRSAGVESVRAEGQGAVRIREWIAPVDDAIEDEEMQEAQDAAAVRMPGAVPHGFMRAFGIFGRAPTPHRSAALRFAPAVR